MPTDRWHWPRRYAAGALVFGGFPALTVAYDWKGGNSPQVRLAAFMGAVPVSWTVRSRDGSLPVTTISFGSPHL